MIRPIILLLISGSLILFSCTSSPKSETRTDLQSDSLPNDFLDFLDEFHSDLDFQKAHIQWPLEGLPPMMDSSYVEGSFRWTADNWVMHHDFDEIMKNSNRSFPYSEMMLSSNRSCISIAQWQWSEDSRNKMTLGI